MPPKSASAARERGDDMASKLQRRHALEAEVRAEEERLAARACGHSASRRCSIGEGSHADSRRSDQELLARAAAPTRGAAEGELCWEGLRLRSLSLRGWRLLTSLRLPSAAALREPSLARAT